MVPPARRHHGAQPLAIRCSCSPQRFAGHPIAVPVQVGVPLLQQLLGAGIAADLPTGELAAVAASRGRGGRG